MAKTKNNGFSSQSVQTFLPILVLLAIIAGYLIYKQNTQTVPSQTLYNTYNNPRLNYSVAIPSDYLSSRDEAYIDPIDLKKLASENKIFGAESRGVEVSDYSFASNQQLLDCYIAGPGFYQCLQDAPDGTFIKISSVYRPVKSFADIIKVDEKVFGRTNLYSPYSFKIADKEAFLWNTSKEEQAPCTKCALDQEVHFIDGKNFEYIIHSVITQSPYGNPQVQAQILDSEKEKILSTISSFKFIK